MAGREEVLLSSATLKRNQQALRIKLPLSQHTHLNGA